MPSKDDMKRAAGLRTEIVSRLKQLRQLTAQTPGDELLNHGANVLVRGLSLVARLLLILLLARSLGPAKFGIFTLIQTTGIVAILTLGYELNAYSRREIVVAKDEVTRTRHVRDQMVIAALLGMGAPVIAIGAAVAKIYPLGLSPFVTLIIYVELVAQEGIRILYALQRVAMGNVVWFVRSSAWVFVLAGMLAWWPQTITLQNVLIIWILFALAAIGVLFWSLRNLPWREALETKVDWGWIGRGFKVASPFYVSTIFVNILNYLPRYILFYLRGAYETGIFGLYTGIAVGIVNLVNTSTVPAGIAQAVRSLAHEGEAAFARAMRRLWFQCAALTILLSLCLLVAFPFILPFVGGKDYPMDWLLLILILVAFAAQIASVVAQTALYAMHRDREILTATIAAGVISAILQFALAYWAGMKGLAIAMALSMVVLTALFMHFEIRAMRDQLQGRGRHQSNQGSGIA